VGGADFLRHWFLISALNDWVVSFTARPLYPGENAPGTQLNGRRVDPESRSGQIGEETNVLSVPEIEPRSVGRSTRSLVTTLTTLSRFHKLIFRHLVTAAVDVTSAERPENWDVEMLYRVYLRTRHCEVSRKRSFGIDGRISCWCVLTLLICYAETQRHLNKIWVVRRCNHEVNAEITTSGPVFMFRHQKGRQNHYCGQTYCYDESSVARGFNFFFFWLCNPLCGGFKICETLAEWAECCCQIYLKIVCLWRNNLSKIKKISRTEAHPSVGLPGCSPPPPNPPKPKFKRTQIL
jgi:hypothetical protein